MSSGLAIATYAGIFVCSSAHLAGDCRFMLNY
jgi:hypothetical protein